MTKFAFGPAAQGEAAQFLAALEDGAVTTVATHISLVLLGRERAYKLKRAVRFPYLDFSTPELRLAMCEREVALNRRFAPGLYLGARRVTREADGRLALDGVGSLVDAVVVMRRFPDDALFDAMARAGKLTKEMMERLARRVAQAHHASPPDYSRGGAAGMRKVLDGAAADLRRAALAPPPEVERHAAALEAALDAQAALLDARGAHGKVRRCHGDLTLRNICLFEGEPTPFDCLEFDEELATIDVLYDLAFLLMDLCRVGARGLANLTFNRYLDERDETEGLPLLPFFMSLRATIRAHVEASQGHEKIARDNFDLARALLAPAQGAVIAIGGLSGSGKSSVTASLAPRLGAAPGARILNSDRIRKRMLGVAPSERLSQEAYASAISAKVYDEMFSEAARVAHVGWPVIVDAVLDRPQDRDALEKVARDADVPFFGAWLHLDLARRTLRVDARVNDVSDATPDVLVTQAQKETGVIAWPLIDASKSVQKIADEIEPLIKRA